MITVSHAKKHGLEKVAHYYSHWTGSDDTELHVSIVLYRNPDGQYTCDVYKIKGVDADPATDIDKTELFPSLDHVAEFMQHEFATEFQNFTKGATWQTQPSKPQNTSTRKTSP